MRLHLTLRIIQLKRIRSPLDLEGQIVCDVYIGTWNP